jgi:hypothetical protein
MGCQATGIDIFSNCYFTDTITCFVTLFLLYILYYLCLSANQHTDLRQKFHLLKLQLWFIMWVHSACLMRYLYETHYFEKIIESIVHHPATGCHVSRFATHFLHLYSSHTSCVNERCHFSLNTKAHLSVVVVAGDEILYVILNYTPCRIM